MLVARESNVYHTVAFRDEGKLIMIIPEALDGLDYAILRFIVHLLIVVEEGTIVILSCQRLLISRLGSNHISRELLRCGIAVSL